MAKLLLVDDHAVVRKGLKKMLESSDELMDIEEVESGLQAVEKVREKSWDAVILDLSLPGKSGISTLKQIKQEQPHLPVLVLSVHPVEQYGIRVLRAGAAGYLNKTCSPEETIQAVKKVLHGGRYVTPELAEHLASKLGWEAANKPHEKLSDRELEIFHLIASGKTPSQVANQLSLSVKTVHTYRRRLLQKMEMKNNAELTRYALKHGIVD